MLHTFQQPVPISTFGDRNSALEMLTPSWVWPTPVINPIPCNALFLLLQFCFLVQVSVTLVILQGRVVSPTPNPQPGRPGCLFQSNPSLQTCPAWLNMAIRHPMTKLQRSLMHTSYHTNDKLQTPLICLVLEKIQFSTVEGFIGENALIWVQNIISVASDITTIYLGFFFLILSKCFEVVFLKIGKFPLTCIFL